MSDKMKGLANKAPFELIGMETALLISTAPSRNIDVSLWFNEKSNNGKTSQKDFDSKLFSLASTMGINQDQETKRELELAVSPLALRIVHSVCQAGEDENHQPLINVSYFFLLCEERVNHYLMQVEAAELGLPAEQETKTTSNDKQDYREWEEGEYDIMGNRINPSNSAAASKQNQMQSEELSTDDMHPEEEDESNDDLDHDDNDEDASRSEDFHQFDDNDVSPEEKIDLLYENNVQRRQQQQQPQRYHNNIPAEDDDDFVHVSAEEYLTDIREKAKGDRPVTAPSGRRGNERGESISQALQYSKDDAHAHSKKSARPSKPLVEPPSPYDEEHPIAFEDLEDDIDTAEYIRSKTHAARPTKNQTDGKAGAQKVNQKATKPTQQPQNGVKKQPFDIGVTNVPVPKKSNEISPNPGKDKKTTDWNEENRRFLMASGAAKEKVRATEAKNVKGPAPKRDLSKPKPRPSSAEPTRIKARNSTPTPQRTGKAQQEAANQRSKSADRHTRQVQKVEEPEEYYPSPSDFDLPENLNPNDLRRHSFNGFNRFSRRSVVNASAPVFKPSDLTEEEINHAKDIVEDQVRNIVKKTDLYHLVQVSLGYIEDYTMIPPRGMIIQSKSKEWLSDREIHLAFLSARLFLNDQSIYMLKRLVSDFANNYRKLYLEKLNNLISFKNNPELENENLPKNIKNGTGQINSEWLKKYLIHLRLTKRINSNQSNKTLLNGSQKEMNALIQKTSQEPLPIEELNGSNLRSSPSNKAATAAASTDKTEEDNNGTTTEEAKANNNNNNLPPTFIDNKTPVQWKEWLAKKLQHEVVHGPKQPKEFSKILNGFANTTLSKEEIELYMKAHSILPEEVLMQEIEYRVESWILDIDGRRDFQHQLNMKIRNYIWEEMIMKQQTSSNEKKIPPNEKVYWKLYYKLSNEEKQSIKQKIITQLILEKRENLKTSERLSKEITKSLFWNYFTIIKERNTSSISSNNYITWTKWLPDHLEKFNNSLEKYKNDKSMMKKQILKQNNKKKALASIISLEKTLKSISTHLDHHHQIQLQKGIIQLRRLAKEKGLGNGEIVTKEDFDHTIKGILTPYISLNDTMIMDEEDEINHPLSSDNIIAKEWKDKISKLFTQNTEETLKQVIDDHENDEQKNKLSYEKWISEKNRMKLVKEQEKEREKEAKQLEEELKKSKSEKAYKKWLRMRKQNKYKSMVDNKYHELPARRLANHDNRWITVEAENNVNHHHFPVSMNGSRASGLGDSIAAGRSLNSNSYDERPLPKPKDKNYFTNNNNSSRPSTASKAASRPQSTQRTRPTTSASTTPRSTTGGQDKRSTSTPRFTTGRTSSKK